MISLVFTKKLMLKCFYVIIFKQFKAPWDANTSLKLNFHISEQIVGSAKLQKIENSEKLKFALTAKAYYLVRYLWILSLK